MRALVRDGSAALAARFELEQHLSVDSADSFVRSCFMSGGMDGFTAELGGQPFQSLLGIIMSTKGDYGTPLHITLLSPQALPSAPCMIHRNMVMLSRDHARSTVSAMILRRARATAMLLMHEPNRGQRVQLAHESFVPPDAAMPCA